MAPFTSVLNRVPNKQFGSGRKRNKWKSFANAFKFKKKPKLSSGGKKPSKLKNLGKSIVGKSKTLTDVKNVYKAKGKGAAIGALSKHLAKKAVKQAIKVGVENGFDYMAYLAAGNDPLSLSDLLRGCK